MRLVVTGANGFVGTALGRAAAEAGHVVVRAVRRACTNEAEERAVGDIDGRTDWQDVLHGAGAVVHLAARVHVMRENVSDPMAAYRATNVDGTRRLAEAAVEAGVRRLVFVSTVKVLGEATTGRPFGPGDPPAPADPYARSKVEAEEVVREVAERSGLEAVIVRPPLVHGPGVGGNLRRLMRLIRMGVPLPLGGVQNHRSLIGVHNLTMLLLHAAIVPQAGGRTLLVADEPPLSTPALIRLMAERMGRPARLWSAPVGSLRGFGRLIGQAAVVGRLVDSLVVDDRQTRELLGWSPPLTLEEGVGAMVSAFQREQSS